MRRKICQTLDEHVDGRLKLAHRRRSHTLCHVRIPATTNGSQTQTPRTKTPQKSRLSRRACIQTHPRDHPLTTPQWKQDTNLREIKVIRRYHLQNREDYHKSVNPHVPRTPLTSPRYNKLCGALRSYAHRLSMLPAQDPFRAQMEAQLLSKLYDIGLLTSQAKLSDVDNKLTVAAFCRRRLAVFMCMSKMAETVSAVRTLLVHVSPTHPHHPRPQSSSNRVTSASVPIRSLIPRSSSPGTSSCLHHTAFP